jgi:hypothetical protein
MVIAVHEGVAMRRSYLECAREGVVGRGRYLLGTLSILFVWLTFGTLLSVGAIALLAPAGVSIEVALDDPELLGQVEGFFALMIQFIPFFLACLAAPLVFHRRSPRTLITGTARIGWGRIGQGFVLWFGLVLVFEAIPYLADPGSYTLQREWRDLLLLPLALVLIPIQATAEELFFRGYLMQWASLRVRNLTSLSVFSGVIFMLPHLLNPEAEGDLVLGALNYFTFGFIIAYAALQDGGLELAIGAHIANNVYASTIVTFEESSLHTPALFFAANWDPLLSLAQVLLAGVLFVVIEARWRRPESEPAASAQEEVS